VELQLGTLKQVLQPVTDLDRAVAFYRDTLQLSFIGQFGQLGFFDLDGVRLLLEPGDGANGSILYFDVDDIHTAHEELASRGVSFEQEPHLIHRDDTGVFGRAGAESWMAFFRDTEGNLLSIACSDQPGADQPGSDQSGAD
jgi:catechol 2,3-dioxygenase-like lactoylglutathione lyase family enzyme